MTREPPDAAARTPLWEYRSPLPLTQWYGHVELLERRAVGQWFCLDIKTGRPLWIREDLEVNTLHGVDEDAGIIIATTTQSRGPCTFNTGVCGISLETGETVWLGPGFGGVHVLRLLVSFLPGLGVQIAGAPRCLIDGECTTENGYVLDVQTGAVLRRIAAADVPDEPDAPALADRIYRAGELVLSDGGRLLASRDMDDFVIARTGPSPWRVALGEHSRFIDGNFHSWRLHGETLYLVVADAPIADADATAAMDADRAGGVGARRGCRYELWELDTSTGRLVARTPLTTRPGGPCRLEAVDDRYALVSHGQTLWCYSTRGLDDPNMPRTTGCRVHSGIRRSAKIRG